MIVGSESSKQPPKQKKTHASPRPSGAGLRPAPERRFLGEACGSAWFPQFGRWNVLRHLGTGINTGNNGLAISWLSFQRETQALKKAKLTGRQDACQTESNLLCLLNPLATPKKKLTTGGGKKHHKLCTNASLLETYMGKILHSTINLTRAVWV